MERKDAEEKVRGLIVKGYRGKSLLTTELRRNFNEAEVCLIKKWSCPHDSYYWVVMLIIVEDSLGLDENFYWTNPILKFKEAEELFFAIKEIYHKSVKFDKKTW